MKVGSKVGNWFDSNIWSSTVSICNVSSSLVREPVWESLMLPVFGVTDGLIYSPIKQKTRKRL
jgi:hypothetical protein